MKQPFLLVLALAATHGESEDAVSREPCPDTCTCSPGISCLFWTTIHFRPDCIAECFSQTPCSVIKKETFLPDSRYILPDRRRGYTCGDGSTKTKIFYPKPIGPPPTAGFPVVMFHRGSSGYYSEHDVSGLGYDAWLESVAKQCLIVIAPQTDGVPWIPSEETSDACKTDKDLLIAMKWAKANLTKLPLPYPSFKADWGSVGAMGHSAGAHHLPRSLKTLRTRTVSTSRLRSSLTAATTCTSTYPTTPWAYTTIHGHVNRPSSLPRMAIHNRSQTTKSPHCTTPECSYTLYKGMHATNKVFANMEKGNHHEPHDPKLHKFAAWTGKFLACHLYPSRSRQAAATCPSIYDNRHDTQRRREQPPVGGHRGGAKPQRAGSGKGMGSRGPCLQQQC